MDFTMMDNEEIEEIDWDALSDDEQNDLGCAGSDARKESGKDAVRFEYKGRWYITVPMDEPPGFFKVKLLAQKPPLN
jgi:hypothetical protein